MCCRGLTMTDRVWLDNNRVILRCIHCRKILKTGFVFKPSDFTEWKIEGDRYVWDDTIQTIVNTKGEVVT